MKPEDALTIMQMNQKFATLDHARAFLSEAADRGLTPFIEIWPIFSEIKKQEGDEWKVIGVKGMTFKEHYNIAARWAQACGGYSTPVRKAEPFKGEVKYGKKTVQKDGIKATVAVLTNRDYSALMNLAVMNIPGFNYAEERAGFLKWGEAFVPNDHLSPSGKDARWVALKRATEEALLNAFGREPSQARQMYTAMLSTSDHLDHADAVAALFGEPAPTREALPAPVQAQVIEAELMEPEFNEAEDALRIAAIAAESLEDDETLNGQPAADANPTAAFFDAVEFGVFKSKNGKLHIGFMGAGQKYPAARWWKSRDELVAAAPWIGVLATKEDLGTEGKRWNCEMRVFYVEDENGYKTATGFAQ